MKLILMSTPYFFIEEHQILKTLFDEGLELLHLRKPDTEPIFSERLLSLIPDSYHKRIVVHDHFYLKNDYGLKGIHLNSRNPELPMNYKGSISCACRTFEELELRKKQMDYVLFSPLLAKRTDEDAVSYLNAIFTDARWKKTIDKRVMLSGGVKLDNISKIKKMGVGGVVVYSDLWNKFNRYSDQDYKALVAHFCKLRKEID